MTGKTQVAELGFAEPEMMNVLDSYSVHRPIRCKPRTWHTALAVFIAECKLIKVHETQKLASHQVIYHLLHVLNSSRFTIQLHILVPCLGKKLIISS